MRSVHRFQVVGVLLTFLIGTSFAAAPRGGEDLRKDLQAIQEALKKDKNAPKWLRIEIHERKDDAHIRINLPLEAVLAFLQLAVEIQEHEMRKTEPKEAREKLEQMERRLSILKRFTPEQWIQWLKELPNGEVVTVESKDAWVRIWVE